jgi:hypothetical protein
MVLGYVFCRSPVQALYVGDEEVESDGIEAAA